MTLARYFVTGNVWLVLALLMVLGSHFERSEPTRVSFFGLGAWFDPNTYNMLVAVCVAVAVICFTLAWKTRRPAI